MALSVSQLTVQVLNTRARVGRLVAGPLRLRCAIGRGGIRTDKREGDGATPAGIWRLCTLHYRPDRLLRPRTGLPVRPLTRHAGWCDAVGDRNYNRAVTHPYPASAERMWRDDPLYDLVIVLSHNRRPRVQGRGSAVFMHLARAGFEPTAGCIALERDAMRRLLTRLTSRTRLVIAAPRRVKRPKPPARQGQNHEHRAPFCRRPHPAFVR